MSGSKLLDLVGNVFDIIFRLALIIAIIYAIYTGAAKCYDYGYRVFTEPPVSSTAIGKDVTITVPLDFSAKELGQLFEEKGLTRDWILLVLQYYGSEYREDMTGGTFTLNTGMTAEEMFAVMAGVTGEEESETK
jgi:UPF0755 protein